LRRNDMLKFIPCAAFANGELWRMRAGYGCQNDAARAH
jgi:hypothetical protein